MSNLAQEIPLYQQWLGEKEKEVTRQAKQLERKKPVVSAEEPQPANLTHDPEELEEVGDEMEDGE